MKARSSNKNHPNTRRLACFNCGNAQRFIEVMAEEAHIVDGDLNYIRLLEAFVDHYVCCECGESLPVPSMDKTDGTMSRRRAAA
jgi:hypothetical protein